jgi:hypothetical protein
VEPLEPIRILLKDADLAGWVRPQSERTTDTLQRGVPLSFLPAGPSQGEWVEIATDEIFMVVPPPLFRRPWRREEREPRRVELQVGAYHVTGTAHLRPGQEEDLYLRATRPFMPLTDAAFSTRHDAEPEPVDALIVNLRWVEEFREV